MTTRKRVFRGDRLRLARVARDISQEDLANAIGIEQSQVTRYEGGKRDPSPEVIVRIARELEVTADWLLGLVDDPQARLEEKDLSPAERQLLAAFRRGDLRDLMRIVASEEPQPEP